MKEILQERRAWSFFERQYLEKDSINEKINIRFLQRIIFFVVLWILDGFGATFVQTKFFSSPVLVNVSLNFFFQWKLKFYTFWFKGALTLWIHWGRHMVRKGAFYFSENPFFSKKWILAPKRRLFDFSALSMSEMEKAPYFWPRTNRVCLKSAFSLF